MTFDSNAKPKAFTWGFSDLKSTASSLPQGKDGGECVGIQDVIDVGHNETIRGIIKE